MPDSTRGLRDRSEDPLDLFPRAMTKLYSLWVSATYPFAFRRPQLIHPLHEFVEQANSSTDQARQFGAHQEGDVVQYCSRGDRRTQHRHRRNCCIAARSVISAKNYIHLERDVILAPSVLIMDHNHAFEDVTRAISEQGTTEGGRIRIGQGSWIGHGAAIVCNHGELDLGAHCVVEPNAVVTRSFPSYSVLSGNPARVIKRFDPVKQAWATESFRSTETVPTK